MSCTSCGDNRCEACWTLLFCIILYDTVYVEHWVEHWGFARPVRVKDSIRITYRSTVLHNTLSCGDQLHTSPFLSSQLFVQCTHEYEEREYGVRVHRSGHGLAGLDRDQRPGWAVFEAPVFSRLKLASSLKIESAILLGEDGIRVSTDEVRHPFAYFVAFPRSFLQRSTAETDGSESATGSDATKYESRSSPAILVV